MADPILTVIDPNTFTEQEYSVEDIELVSSQEIESPFNTNLDSVELYWYDTNQQLIASNTNYTSWKSYQDSSIPTTGQLQALYLDPIIDGQAAGISNGDVFLVYNFVSNKLTSSNNNRFYISSISADRTEVSLKSNNISDETLIAEVAEFKADLETGQYFEDFYLNFGDNDRLIGLNIRTIDVEGETEVQVKLYDPLPNQYQEKTTLWIQIDVAGSTGYKVTYDEEIILPDTTQRLRGPNLNINPTSGNSSEYQSSDSLRTANLTGSVSQLKNLLGKYQVKLNIDYTDYSNFVHFSSATQRLENFHYKASLIESYQNDIDAITGSTAPTLQQSQSIASLQGEIDRIISNFDGYDYYLYYESGSKAWPKTNSTKPYSLASTGSAAVISWYGTPGVDGTGQLQSASLYDNENQDNLIYSIPEFIREDSANTGYELFIEMIGQHFDNLYLYTEAITQKYNADNRLDYGVSKDLVADTLRSFGVKLYENNFSTDDLYTALIGLTPEGSTLPLPSISTTFPVTGSGLEYIETIISASNEVIPLDDLNKSIYKRLYHNLPALVKKKGTLAGIKLLVNTYGIPDTILRINEFGGKDKNSNTWDYWQNEYDYAFDTQGTNFITSSFSVNTAWGTSNNVPGAVAFRFKTSGIPSESNYSQSLWSTDGNNALRLKYVGTADTSGSYSGSIVNPYNKYGRLEFFPDSTDLNSSASLYLPLFDGGWWSVLINKNSDSSFTVYSGNSIYNGTDGNTLGFTAADSVTKIGNWSGSIESYFGSSSLDATLFSGSLQEIRYYKNPISRSVFNDFVMNPDSIEGNGLNSSPDQLIFRAALGSELYTGSVSIHPKVSGEWTTTASFTSDSNFYFNSTPVYQTNTGIGFYDQPAVGIKNAVSNKIRLEDSTLYGTTLSGLASLQQNYPASESYTRNVNYLEVGYSPQNEINEDIMDSIGYFNIGDYIGDPRQFSSTDLVYPDLEELKKDYFKKYNKSYNYQDYFRIIKFYDNSLFKMIKDFIPARTAAATGAIVKQHLLERNRQRPAQVSYSEPYYTASVFSVARDYESGSIGVFEGGPAGAVNNWINVSQSYTASVLGPEGLVTYIESSEREFYNGTYSGSRIECQLSESINITPLLNNVSSSRLSIKYEDVDYNSDALNPTNLTLIQSGSAYKAAVQDSNYDPKSAFFETRFGGTKNTGEYNFTENIAPQSLTSQYPIDYFTPYFAYFDWVGGSDPQYPGGGNTHITKLINAETREVITLSEENKYLDSVAQIYKAGNPVYLIPFSASTTNEIFNSRVIEGGALYSTILYKSGSNDSNEGFIANYATFQPAYTGSLVLTSGPSLRDTGAANAGWLYAVNTTSSIANGALDPERSYGIPSGSNFGIYNQRTGQYVTASSAQFIQGAFSSSIAYRDTLFPIRKNDFVRFGYTPDSPYGVDKFFSLGTNLVQIKDITLGSDSGNASIVNVTDISSIPIATRQNYRIFRRVPNETFILTDSITYRGSGLLIPYNLDPKYSPVEIASELGL